MLTLVEIRRRLQDRRVDMVARATGLHRNTVQAVRSGSHTNPTYRVMLALSDYLTDESDAHEQR